MLIIQSHFHQCWQSYDEALFKLLCSLKGFAVTWSPFFKISVVEAVLYLRGKMGKTIQRGHTVLMKCILRF